MCYKNIVGLCSTELYKINFIFNQYRAATHTMMSLKLQLAGLLKKWNVVALKYPQYSSDPAFCTILDGGGSTLI